jgi:hypothetical protein
MDSEVTHNIYQITGQLHESKHIKTKLLNMDEQQTELFLLILKNFQGVAMRNTGGKMKKISLIVFLSGRQCISIYSLLAVQQEFNFKIKTIFGNRSTEIHQILRF